MSRRTWGSIVRQHRAKQAKLEAKKAVEKARVRVDDVGNTEFDLEARSFARALKVVIRSIGLRREAREGREEWSDLVMFMVTPDAVELRAQSGTNRILVPVPADVDPTCVGAHCGFHGIRLRKVADALAKRQGRMVISVTLDGGSGIAEISGERDGRMALHLRSNPRVLAEARVLIEEHDAQKTLDKADSDREELRSQVE